MHHHDAITRRAVFRNIDKRKTCSSIMLSNNNKKFECGSGSKVLLKASSLSIDFEAEPHPFHLLQLSGRYILLITDTAEASSVIHYSNSAGLAKEWL